MGKEIDWGIVELRVCVCVFCYMCKRRRFDEPGTERPEQNRGVPAGVGPEFPERTGIKTGTKTTPFYPGLMNGTDFTTMMETTTQVLHLCVCGPTS